MHQLILQDCLLLYKVTNCWSSSQSTDWSMPYSNIFKLGYGSIMPLCFTPVSPLTFYHAILMLQGITIYRYSDGSCRIYGCGMWYSTSTVCKEETWEWRCVSVCCWTVNVYSILIRFYGGVSVQHAYYLGMCIKVIWYCITSLGWLWLARQYELFCKLGLYHCSFIPIKK